MAHPKIANITPIPMLDEVLTEKDNFHLVLTNLILSDQKYLDFYRNRIAQGDYVILDVPAFETSQPTSTTSVDAAAAMLMPSEVVLPDDITSAKNTIALAHQCKTLLERASYPGKTMGVPHGTDYREYIDCAVELVEDVGVNVLGIVEEIPELYGYDRLPMVQKLAARLPETEFHLLGIDDELKNFHVPDHIPVRSIDTAKFVVYGLNKIDVWPNHKHTPAYPGRKTVGGRAGYFFHNDLDPEVLECIKGNIERFRI